MTVGPLYIAGHRGMVGSAIWREAERRGIETVGRTHAELDLTDEQPVRDFIAETKPSTIVLAAAKVGGIMANSTYPADFLEQNLRIQLNVMSAAVEAGVPRLLFLGSSCIYPKFAPQPIQESSLLTGPLEPTNDAYAIAKIAGVLQVQAIRRQHGLRYISAMPTNLYGPGDNFDLEKSHVLPAMIRRMHEAKVAGAVEVALWGTGTPRREFLHVDDLARAVFFLLDEYDEPEPINVGTGVDLEIRELAELVRQAVGFEGEIRYDTSKPDGTPRKQLDISKIEALGWKPTIDLDHGVADVYEWFLEHSQVDARL